MLLIVAALLVLGQSASGDAVGQVSAPASARTARALWLAEHAFEMADADHDGRLSRDDYRAMTWLSYREHDHDADDRLDRDEFADMRCGGYGPDVPGVQPYRAWCLTSAARDFRRLSRDGAITPRSIRGEADGFFHFNDINHDGFVTHAEELTAARRAGGR